MRDGEAQASPERKEGTGQIRDTTRRPANKATSAAGSLAQAEDSDSDDNPACSPAYLMIIVDRNNVSEDKDKIPELISESNDE